VAIGRLFRRDDRGATAIEFAFVAPLAILILVATVEIGVMEIMSSNLDAAVLVASRKIRTGASDRPASNADLVTMVCAKMAESPQDCRSRLSISVQRVANFASAQSVIGDTPNGQFDAGGPGDIIVVAATYSWPLALPGYAGTFKLASPSQALIDTRATFRNEPYL
jgi:Flp pilus assembly protein TadG